MRASYVDVRSAGTDEWDSAAYSNYIDASYGSLFCNENYKDRDVRSQDRRLWPSEVLWQNRQRINAEPGTQVSGLRAIIRFRIVNNQTKRAIWVAANRSSASRIEENNYTEYTWLDNGFCAILGSPNGASTMRMLLDHKKSLGFRVVENVTVLGEDTLTMNEPESRSIVLFLSGRRTPPTKMPRPITAISKRKYEPGSKTL